MIDTKRLNKTYVSEPMCSVRGRFPYSWSSILINPYPNSTLTGSEAFLTGLPSFPNRSWLGSPIRVHVHQPLQHQIVEHLKQNVHHNIFVCDHTRNPWLDMKFDNGERLTLLVTYLSGSCAHTATEPGTFSGTGNLNGFLIQIVQKCSHCTEDVLDMGPHPSCLLLCSVPFSCPGPVYQPVLVQIVERAI